MEEDKEIPLTLERPFLAIGRALIDVQEGKLIMRMQDEEITFNVLESMKAPSKQEPCLKIDVVDQSRIEPFQRNNTKVEIQSCIIKPNQFESEDHYGRGCTKFRDKPQLSLSSHKERVSKIKKGEVKPRKRNVVGEKS